MDAESGPRGSTIVAALKAAGVGHVAALPDITTSAGLLWPLSRDPGLRLIRLCKEDEGVAICAGLAFCKLRSVLLMQQTGFFDSINAVRAIGVEYGQPVCMLIGLLEKEPDRPPSASARYGVRIVEPILDAMGIDRLLIEGPDGVELLAPAIVRAYRTSRPLAALIGRPVAP